MDGKTRAITTGYGIGIGPSMGATALDQSKNTLDHMMMIDAGFYTVHLFLILLGSFTFDL